MKSAVLCGVVLLITIAAVAQVPAGADKNAALRYWTAFSLMSDLNLTDAESRQIEAIVSGAAPWDEKTFGKLVEVSSGAVETMVRGTALPYCVWGVDYQLGPAAPVPQVALGRVLARLNILTAQRLAAQGNSKAATVHLVAGIRFARDLSQDMPLIGVLTGKLALTSDLKAAAALGSRLSTDDKAALARAVGSLPPEIFDWSRAVQLELRGTRTALVQLQKSRDPRALLTEWGEDPGKFGGDLRPSETDLHEFDAIVTEASVLFRQPASQVQTQIAALDNKIQTLRPTVKDLIPSLRHANEARQQIENARQDFLRTIGG